MKGDFHKVVHVVENEINRENNINLTLRKAPGYDELHPEMPKYLNEKAIIKLTKILVIVWAKNEVPKL